LSSLLLSQEPIDDFDSLALDIDAMWDQVIWEEIENITDVYYEVEYITATAGVRGAEAEDEALYHLYYRKSMTGPSQMELRIAYGKLRNKIDQLKKINKNHPELEKLYSYIKQLELKIKV
jgi:hypothetical protein